MTGENEAADVDTDSAEDIAEARSLGWKSPDEWKGKAPERGFMSAKQYVERGRTVLPVIESQLKKEREAKARLQNKLDALERESAAKYANLERMSKAALDQQRRLIEAQYEAKKEAAIEIGDKAAYREAAKAEKEAIADLEERAKPAKDEKADKRDELPPEVSRTIDEWKAENEWFTDDEDMRAVAEKHHYKLIRDKPSLSLRENLDQVAEYVKKKFPAEFKSDDAEDDDDEPAPRKRGSPVEGGSRMNGGGNRSAWSRVPSDDRKHAENAGHLEWYLKPGETMEKNAAQARERWAAKYFEGEQS